MIYIAPAVENIEKTKNPRTRRILRQRQIIYLLTIILEIEIEASEAKLWIGLQRKILIQIREASEANPIILP